jgi:hypothetical protein
MAVTMENKKEQPRSRPIDHVCATHWPTYIREAIKTGLESPTPYKVIPFKNGMGIKKIEFVK